MFLKCWEVSEEEGEGTGLVEKRIFFLKNIWSWCGRGGGIPIHYALVGGGRGESIQCALVESIMD